MEVSMNNFWRMLPKILISIAEADFVAFDVEMTGISDKLSEAAYSQNNQTRQHIYEHGKRIASTFNLFQFGFTCLTAQRDGSYSTESFSFNVSPLLIEDTREDEFFAQDIGRNLTVSLNALKFLRREGQQLEKIFSNPVPYLSRKEIREARERLESRKTPRVLRDHQYNEDEEGLNFFSAYVFDAISTWLDDRSDDKPSDIKISIPPADSKKRASVYHKIVRTAAQNMVPFMKCRTWNYGATVLIYMEGFDEESERVKTAGDRLDASIKKQKGIGIVIEALAGGDFAHEIDPSQDGGPEEMLYDQVAHALLVLNDRLQMVRPVLVGHNQFWDLLFLYRTFIDDLPGSAGEFFTEIHELFPRILDTKILAISDQAIEGEDPLADIFDRLDVYNATPRITWDPLYGYNHKAEAHEAGFDSFMTASVLVRLGHKLARQSRLDIFQDSEDQNKKLRGLYSKGWLEGIGHNPECFGSDAVVGFGSASEESDDDDASGESLSWDHAVFEPLQNSLRIGPSTTVFLERQWLASRAFRDGKLERAGAGAHAV
ncbi:Poly(A)-specific ribonuclease PARN [Colletotrichum trifolii]|uniref:Poly(A)-specific ribonuclease PARN n=1 Tax=Colletotrichum trifolii TaxID=5466 RepID=A0A4V3HWR6_COLTR|nr:Poly(A)-specific ribonuclease PARN [Colletotrichum trifolii]